MARKNSKNKPVVNTKKKPASDKSGKMTVAAHQQFSGPLPPPAMMEEYDQIISDGAERLFAMAEKEGQHRHYCEKKTVDSSAAFLKSSAIDARLGLILGFVVAISFLASAMYLILHGYSIEGTILGGLDLCGIVGVFVYGSKNTGSHNNHT